MNGSSKGARENAKLEGYCQIPKIPQRIRKGMRNSGTKIFIGHGRNPGWRELKDFIQDTLKLVPDEFNLECVAGKTNKERLLKMLDDAPFAFLIFTAEDEHT